MTSKADLWSQLKYRIKLANEFYKFAALNSPNFLAMVADIKESYSGDNVANAESALSSIRSALNTSISTHKSMIEDLLIELAKIGYNGHADNVDDALYEIYDGMQAGTETVLNRGFSLGTITDYASNVGSGVLYRLTHDENGHVIESGYDFTTTIKAIIVKDKNTGGQAGKEEALIRGDGGILPTDDIYRGTMTGESYSFYVVDSGDGVGLQNPSFAANSGSSPSVTISPWVVTSQADIDIDTTNYFKVDSGFGSSATGSALQFLDNNKIEQKSVTNFSIDPDLPVFFLVRYRRQNSCDGTLTIRLGSQTDTVDVSTKNNDEWNTIILGSGTSTKGWYKNFKEDDENSGLRVSVELSSRTTGDLLIDHLILCQPFQFNGHWWLLVSGEDDFLEGDYSYVTDTLSTQGIIQYWIARLFGVYFPHTSSGPTYTDPT